MPAAEAIHCPPQLSPLDDEPALKDRFRQRDPQPTTGRRIVPQQIQHLVSQRDVMRFVALAVHGQDPSGWQFGHRTNQPPEIVVETFQAPHYGIHFGVTLLIAPKPKWGRRKCLIG